MKFRLLAVSLAAASPFALAGIASAADGDFSITPTSGPAGTVVEASGDCPTIPEGAQDPGAVVLLVDGEDVITGIDEALAEDGTFTVTFEVPEDTDPGSFEVVAACFEGNSEEEDPFFEFEPVAFTVEASEEPSPEPEPSAEPEPEPTEAPEAPAPTRAPAPAKAPATPVEVEPTFTG